MKTMIFYRVLVILTLLVGLLMICSANLFLIVSFFAFFGASYIALKGKSIEEINKILMVDKFKKIGIDIDE